MCLLLLREREAFTITLGGGRLLLLLLLLGER